MAGKTMFRQEGADFAVKINSGLERDGQGEGEGEGEEGEVFGRHRLSTIGNIRGWGSLEHLHEA
jgi:hypothetical protein